MGCPGTTLINHRDDIIIRQPAGLCEFYSLYFLKALIGTGIQEELRVNHQNDTCTSLLFMALFEKLIAAGIWAELRVADRTWQVIESSNEKNKEMQVLRGKSKSFKHIPISFNM